MKKFHFMLLIKASDILFQKEKQRKNRFPRLDDLFRYYDMLLQRFVCFQYFSTISSL